MQDLTVGSVGRHLFKTTSFMLVTMMFQTLYFLVDLYCVGRLGKEAVAGVAVAGNLMFLVLAMTQMLGVGATTLISHATGRKDPDRARFVFQQAVLLSVFSGAAFFVVMMLLRVPYARLLAADAATAQAAEDYLQWFVPAMSLQFALVTMSAALRGTGNFKPGMLVQGATVLINMILAPVLIFGWPFGRPLGVAGAAIATLIAIAVGNVWMSTFFLSRDGYLRFERGGGDDPRQGWRPHIDLWLNLLKVGLPAGAEFALISMYLLVVYIISRPFGAAAQAGFGIGLRIIQAGFMPLVALGFAVAPLAGQNFGARRADRVRETYRVGLISAVGLALVFALLSHAAPAAMMRVFSSDPDVVRFGGEYLRIISFSYVASGVIFVSGSLFQAIGNTVPSLVASALRIGLVAGPSFVLSTRPGFQLSWIWLLSVIAVALQMVLVLLLLRREMRRRLVFPAGEAGATASSPVAPSGSAAR